MEVRGEDGCMKIFGKDEYHMWFHDRRAHTYLEGWAWALPFGDADNRQLAYIRRYCGETVRTGPDGTQYRTDVISGPVCSSDDKWSFLPLCLEELSVFEVASLRTRDAELDIPPPPPRRYEAYRGDSVFRGMFDERDRREVFDNRGV